MSVGYINTFMVEIRNTMHKINCYCVHTTSVTMVTFVFVSHEVFWTSRDANAASTTKNYNSLHVLPGNGNSMWRNWRWSIRPSSTALPFAPVADEPSVHVRSALEFIDYRAFRIRARPPLCDGSQLFNRGPSGHHGRKFAWGRRETTERGKVIGGWWWWCASGLAQQDGRSRH